MPPYPWLHEATIDVGDVQSSVRALKRAGVPYIDADVEGVAASLSAQGQEIVASLAATNLQTTADAEIVALIAYLQRLGREGKAYLSSQGGGE